MSVIFLLTLFLASIGCTEDREMNIRNIPLIHMNEVHFFLFGTTLRYGEDASEVRWIRPQLRALSW